MPAGGLSLSVAVALMKPLLWLSGSGLAAYSTSVDLGLDNQVLGKRGLTWWGRPESAALGGRGERGGSLKPQGRASLPLVFSPSFVGGFDLPCPQRSRHPAPRSQTSPRCALLPSPLPPPPIISRETFTASFGSWWHPESPTPLPHMHRSRPEAHLGAPG